MFIFASKKRENGLMHETLFKLKDFGLSRLGLWPLILSLESLNPGILEPFASTTG
jgi:hypothetical protein